MSTDSELKRRLTEEEMARIERNISEGFCPRLGALTVIAQLRNERDELIHRGRAVQQAIEEAKQHPDKPQYAAEIGVRLEYLQTYIAYLTELSPESKDG